MLLAVVVFVVIAIAVAANVLIHIHIVSDTICIHIVSETLHLFLFFQTGAPGLRLVVSKTRQLSKTCGMHVSTTQCTEGLPSVTLVIFSCSDELASLCRVTIISRAALY